MILIQSISLNSSRLNNLIGLELKVKCKLKTVVEIILSNNESIFIDVKASLYAPGFPLLLVNVIYDGSHVLDWCSHLFVRSSHRSSGPSPFV